MKKYKGMAMAGILLGLVAVFACTPYVATYEYTASPEKTAYRSTVFQVRFKPVKVDFEYYSGFHLDVTNESREPIEIDWNKTRYLMDGRNLGGFMFPGVDPEAVPARTVPPQEILSQKKFSVYIYPENRGEAALNEKYHDEILPPGEHTIFLVIRANDKLIKKRLSISIIETVGGS